MSDPEIRVSSDLPSRRCLGLTSATAVVAASMIGAGVYTTSGFSIASFDSPWIVVATWVIGGIVAVCGAIGYASLARRFTESGGEYLFLSKTLHPAAGVMAGWVSVLAGFTGPIAVAAMTLEVYAGGSRWVGTSFPAGSIACGAILAAAVLHSISVRPSARVQDVVVALKLLLLLGLVQIAATVPRSDWQGWLPAPDAPAFSWASFATALLYVSFSYSGFNAAIYIAGEVRDAETNVPRAMVGGTVIVAALYVLLNAAFVLIPPREAIAMQPDVAVAAATEIGGDWLSTAVRVIIVVSLATSVSALIMTGPRVYAKMADDGFLPGLFRFQNRVPLRAIWIQAAASMAVVVWSDLKSLLEYLGFTLMLCTALTVSMVLPDRQASLFGSTRLPRIAAAVYVIASLLTATVAAFDKPLGALAALITIGFGIAMFAWDKRTNIDRKGGHG